VAAWMKAALAVVALGAVVGLAVILVSDDGESGAGASTPGQTRVQQQQSGSGAAMELPESEVQEASELKASAPAAELVRDVPEVPDSGATTAAQDSTGPQLTLTGRMVDNAGRPISEVRIVFEPALAGRIVLLGRGSDESAIDDSPETVTDRDGVFNISGPAPESDEDSDLPGFLRNGAQLYAVHPRYATLATDVPQLSEGEHDMGPLVMDLGVQITGRVVDDMGRIVHGADVTGRHVQSSQGGPGRMFRFMSGRGMEKFNKSTSGPDGRFDLFGLPEGGVEVTAQAEGKQVGVSEGVDLELGGRHDIGDIVLQSGELIAGYVMGDDGEPVVGATVRLSSMARIMVRRMEDLPRRQLGQEMRIREQTDEQGHFEILGLGAGQYTVHVSADGFGREDIEDVPTGTSDLSVMLAPLGRLEVRVAHSSTLLPVGDVRIEARAQREGHFGPPGDLLEVVGPDEDAVGSDRGLFTVLGAGRSGTSLVLAAKGFATLEIEGPAVESGGLERLSVSLVPESVLAGRVVDADGTGIVDATVRIQAHDPPSNEEGGWAGHEVRREIRRTIGGGPEQDLMDETTRARTDADGYFEMPGISAGDWELTARAENFVNSEATILSLDAGQSQRDVEVVLEVGGAVVGKVLERDGTPVTGVDVLVSLQTGRSSPSGGGGLMERFASFGGGDGDVSFEPPKRATTDGAGSFAVHSLKPGTYDVKLAKLNGMGFGNAMVFIDDGSGGDADENTVVAQVVAGEETYVEVIQQPLATLEGKVMAGGRPVEVTLVSLKEQGSFMPFGGQTAQTDRYGNYVFENVEPGEYEVSTIVPGAAMEETVAVSLAGGESVEADIVFGGATLTGRVTDSETDRGIDDVTIIVTPVSNSGEEQVQKTFAIVTMEMSGGGGGSGMQMDIGGGSQSKVHTDADGNFEVLYLKPGEYSIETLGGGYIAGSAGPVTVEDGDDVDDVDIELARGAALSGLVRSGATGDVLEAVPVSLSSPAGKREMTMTQNGRYSFDSLGEGDYTLSVMGSGFGGAPLVSEVVTLAVGEVRTLDLTTDS
jgi:hypothetical protein